MVLCQRFFSCCHLGAVGLERNLKAKRFYHFNLEIITCCVQRGDRTSKLISAGHLTAEHSRLMRLRAESQLFLGTVIITDCRKPLSLLKIGEK